MKLFVKIIAHKQRRHWLSRNSAVEQAPNLFMAIRAAKQWQRLGAVWIEQQGAPATKKATAAEKP